MTHSYWYKTSAPKRNYSRIILGRRESMEMNPGALPVPAGCQNRNFLVPRSFLAKATEIGIEDWKTTEGRGFLERKMAHSYWYKTSAPKKTTPASSWAEGSRWR